VPTDRPSLQAEIFAIPEEIEPATVRYLVDRIHPQRAFTTVATVPGRMLDQGHVTRAWVRGRWEYRVAAEHNRKLAQRLASHMDHAAGDPDPLLHAFVGRVEQMDSELLDRLEALIAKRRRRRR
jgi:predicted transcriptional regulator